MTGDDPTRGFSTSASLLLIFVGLVSAMTVWYSASSNAMERVQEAELDQVQHTEDIQRTSINATEATLITDTAPCELSLEVNNTGSRTLSVNDTDLLLDGTYQTGWEDAAAVDGNADTDVWGQAQTLNVTVGSLTAVPDRATFVTGTGVTAVKDIDGGLLCS